MTLSENSGFWEHVVESNRKQAEENIEGWSKMIEQRKEFLEKLTALSEFMEDYPTCFVALQTELKKATDYTKWGIKECRLNLN